MEKKDVPSTIPIRFVQDSERPGPSKKPPQQRKRVPGLAGWIYDDESLSETPVNPKSIKLNPTSKSHHVIPGPAGVKKIPVVGLTRVSSKENLRKLIKETTDDRAIAPYYRQGSSTMDSTNLSSKLLDDELLGNESWRKLRDALDFDTNDEKCSLAACNISTINKIGKKLGKGDKIPFLAGILETGLSNNTFEKNLRYSNPVVRIRDASGTMLVAFSNEVLKTFNGFLDRGCSLAVTNVSKINPLMTFCCHLF